MLFLFAVVPVCCSYLLFAVGSVTVRFAGKPVDYLHIKREFKSVRFCGGG